MSPRKLQPKEVVRVGNNKARFLGWIDGDKGVCLELIGTKEIRVVRPEDIEPVPDVPKHMPWAEYLEARLAMIAYWTEEGKSPEDIVALLKVNLVQIRLLQETIAHRKVNPRWPL